MNVSLLPNNDLVVKTYEADVAKGETIISRMSGKVHNAIWEKLVSNKSTRDILAAALGADKYLSSHGQRSFALDLGPVLSGLHQSNGHHHQTAVASLADRIKKPKIVKKYTPTTHQVKRAKPMRIGYDVFAPGIIPSVSHPARLANQPKFSTKLKSPKTAAKVPILAALRAGLLGATGLSDRFAPSETPLARLQRKVQQLKASLEKEKARLRAAQAKHLTELKISKPRNAQVESSATRPVAPVVKSSVVHKSQSKISLPSAAASPIDRTGPIKETAESKGSMDETSHAVSQKGPATLSNQPAADNTEQVLNDILQESHTLNQAAIAVPGPKAAKPAVVPNRPAVSPSALLHQRRTADEHAKTKGAVPSPTPVLIRRKARPLLCALPLLAENSGVDCHQVPRVSCPLLLDVLLYIIRRDPFVHAFARIMLTNINWADLSLATRRRRTAEGVEDPAQRRFG